MKTRVLARIVGGLVFLLLLNSFPIQVFADGAQTNNAPTYRGKVVLIVDKTIATDPDVGWKIQRLIDDLTGDGWRVLRHDVDRGPEFPIQPSEADAEFWAAQNAPRVREIRALIQADYRSAPTEVKNVFLLGHVAIPYSGTAGLNGGHYAGAQPADTFYGEMTGWYGIGGWSDTQTEISAANPNVAPWLTEALNRPNDGKFDQNTLPAPMKVGVGRVDFNRMWDMGVNEATLLSRYLDKDHDFRCSNFSVQRRAIVAGEGLITSTASSAFGDTLGSQNVLVNLGNYSWFPKVSASGQDYLMGEGDGHSGGNGNPFVGTTAESPPNDFLSSDSRVVFVNLWGSWFGDWDSGTFLKAPLANPYDPANGRYGYGLTAVYWAFGLDDATLTSRQLGATIGEALFIGRTQTIPGVNGFSVNYGLMGDPTLRNHSVQQLSGLAIVNNGSTVTLNWTASADPAVTSYNVYSAPTRKGPYILVNTAGPVTSTSYTAARSQAGSAPDNYYMVRAIKPETTPVGSYVNMAEGVIASVPGALTPYLSIITQPVSQTAAAHTKDGIANSVVFTIDAVGCDTAGNQQITYQWYNANGPLTEDCHFKGVNTSSLIISGLQTSDADNYHVIVGNRKPFTPAGAAGDPNTAVVTMTSSTATLTINDPPTGVNDSFSIIRNTPSDFNVLANDTDPDTANSALTVISISGPSAPTAGTLTINPDQRTIHFTPTASWLGQFTFTYLVFDGITADQGTVTVTVNPTPGDTITASSIADQQMAEDTTIDIPFTVTDSFTAPDNLTYAGACSNPALIPGANFSVTGTGNNRILHVKAGTHQFGSGTVTLTVTDYDLQSATVTFKVTINPVSVPTLLSTGLQPDGFHFTINGPANSTVEIKESADLVTWTSLGSVTLSGNSYSFVDGTVGSGTQRFYSANDQNGCSANIIGFVTVTVPTQASSGAQAYISLSNPLNNPAGNTIDVLFSALPGGSLVDIWDPNAQTYTITRKRPATLLWGSTPALNPGMGAAVHAGGTTPVAVTFVGDVPTGQQINSFAAVQGEYYMLGSIIPLTGTFTQLGFPAMEGDQIQKLDSTQQNFLTVATYSGGVWTPSVPTLQPGEAFFLVSGQTANRTWTENLSTCSPEVKITSPSDGSTFVGPSSVPLNATATASAGLSKVEFFQGNTSLGLGTHTGNTFFTYWNNPAPGSYSITAHATDNNGITTISTPVNIIVYAQPTLGSESYSAGNFQFTINGSDGVSVNLFASTDLTTWTPVGTVTLTGGSYNYTDTSAGSFTQRYYRVKQNGVCSGNTIGFLTVTVPATNSSGGQAYITVSNPLNNPNGNTPDVLFGPLPKGSRILTWNPASNYTIDQKILNPPVWSLSPAPVLNPGTGFLLHAGGTTPVQITFVGDVPEGQQVQSFSTTAGSYYLLTSMIPLAGTLDQLGFPAMEGDQIQKLDNTQANFVTVATYSGGAWTPSAPTAQAGESFFLLSGQTANRTWTENLPTCMPDVVGVTLGGPQDIYKGYTGITGGYTWFTISRQLPGPALNVDFFLGGDGTANNSDNETFAIHPQDFTTSGCIAAPVPNGFSTTIPSGQTSVTIGITPVNGNHLSNMQWLFLTLFPQPGIAIDPNATQALVFLHDPSFGQ
jgi:hypothetical protein